MPRIATDNDIALDALTIVLVLHDVNQASRYSQHVIAMRDGQILA